MFLSTTSLSSHRLLNHRFASASTNSLCSRVSCCSKPGQRSLSLCCSSSWFAIYWLISRSIVHTLTFTNPSTPLAYTRTLTGPKIRPGISCLLTSSLCGVPMYMTKGVSSLKRYLKPLIAESGWSRNICSKMSIQSNTNQELVSFSRIPHQDCLNPLSRLARAYFIFSNPYLT
jgi:hypothetical protein